MGLFDKLKNVFLEDEEEEVVQKTVEPVPVKEPKIEKVELPDEFLKKEKPVETESVSDRDLFDTKDNFKFPIIFEEDDFKEEKKKTKSINVLERTNTKYEPTKIEKPQKFKPSLVISPVYGVLDKNYTKDDIVTKDGLLNDSSLDIDSVIRKAYGEDKSVVITREEKKTIETEPLTEPVINEEVTETVMVFDDHDKAEDTIEYNTSELDEKIKSIDELLTETTDDDFYSLVDSMYQNKEEE